MEFSSKVAEAEAALIQFFDAMCAWENKSYALAKNLSGTQASLSEHMVQAQEELRVLFEAHCLPGEVDLGRLTTPRVNSPSVYDRRHGSLYESSSGKDRVTFVYHQHEGTEDRIRFTLHRTPEGWRIARAEYFDCMQDDWRPYVL